MSIFGAFQTRCLKTCTRFNFSKVSAVDFSVAATSGDSVGTMLNSKALKKTEKLLASMSEAVSDIPDGAKILIGGFGDCGVPENLIKSIVTQGCKNLTLMANNTGKGDFGISLFLKERRVKRIVASYIGENPDCQRRYMSGEIELELTPQGTLAERLRAGGAGIPAFYTPTGYGTIVQEGKIVIKYDKAGNAEILGDPKEVREFNGRNYVLERALTADFALVKAWKADKAGNLIFRKSARNFNPVMSKAAKVTIAEAEEILEIGQLDPDSIHLPGIYVDRVVQGRDYERRVEQRPPSGGTNSGAETRDRIARRAALEFKDGTYVNIGVGIPTRAADFISKNKTVTLHSENGILGFGPAPPPDQIDSDVISSAKFPLTLNPGASITGSDESFAIIRGGHLDVAMLGALQVSQKGDLANWIIPGALAMGMGGAMDLISAARTKVIVTMQHTKQDGSPKILQNCTIPVTGLACVDMIITELAVFEVEKGKGLKLIEMAPGVDVAQIRSSTGCDFSVADELKVMGQIPIDDES